MSDTKAAATEFQAAEREAASIRDALKKLGTESAVEETNSFTVKWIETTGSLPSDFTSLHLQLSSPVEDILLKNPGESHEFHGVELAQATLTCNKSDTHDVTELTLNLLEPLKDDNTAPLKSSLSLKVGDATIQLETAFVPSPSDIRTALYELLNNATQRKAMARDVLAKASSQQQKQQQRAVPAGFLNKTTTKSTGPSSWTVAKTVVMEWGPRVKNYLLFGAFCLVANYRGHWLAIPAPV